jgi:pyridoxine kinase
LIDECVDGLAALGRLPSCDGILSGYAGRMDLGEAVLRAVGRVKAANAAACYCCDPVIGDAQEGFYVQPELAAFMAQRAVPAADLITPNLFELEYLSASRVASQRDLVAAIDVLHRRGPSVVLVTSVHLDDTPPDAIDTVVSAKGSRARLRTPRLALAAKGAGDMLAALFFAHWLSTGSATSALGRAGSSLFGVLQRTAQTASPDLLMIAAQDEFITPSRTFVPDPF